MELLTEGRGELLGWHDPEEHREWVRQNKSTALEEKVMSIKTAVSRFVKDGLYIALGGFGHVRVSMVGIYEIIRQRKRGLTVAAKPGVHDLDLLIAGGCVSKMDSAYSCGHELRGLSPASRRNVENGKVKIAAEWSNAALQWRLKAAASGVPFTPAYTMLGTDTFNMSAAKASKDPFTGRPICLIPACYPDVSIIHVHNCDKYGNSQIDGIRVMDVELARASRRLIITTENIISNRKIREEPWRTVIPYFYVDAVVKAPYGCHPCNMPTMYYFDEVHFAEYLKYTRSEEGTGKYLNKYVYGVEKFYDYINLIGGAKKIRYLRMLEKGKATLTYPWAKS